MALIEVFPAMSKEVLMSRRAAAMDTVDAARYRNKKLAKDSKIRFDSRLIGVPGTTTHRILPYATLGWVQ